MANMVFELANSPFEVYRTGYSTLEESEYCSVYTLNVHDFMGSVFVSIPDSMEDILTPNWLWVQREMINERLEEEVLSKEEYEGYSISAVGSEVNPYLPIIEISSITFNEVRFTFHEFERFLADFDLQRKLQKAEATSTPYLIVGAYYNDDKVEVLLTDFTFNAVMEAYLYTVIAEFVESIDSLSLIDEQNIVFVTINGVRYSLVHDIMGSLHDNHLLDYDVHGEMDVREVMKLNSKVGSAV